jgi:hypothetical protein
MARAQGENGIHTPVMRKLRMIRRMMATASNALRNAVMFAALFVEYPLRGQMP